jgi:protein-tyrosine phosphatase
MYDVHHHLLYGLDDGPASIDLSIAMAEMAIADGITHVVCTPHASDRYPYQPEENAARLTILREKLMGRINLGIGCDFHLNYENIQDASRNPHKYSINAGQYLLIEFPDFGIPPSISEALYELRLAGLTLIITHPERNQTLRTHPERLAEWLREGHLIQITAGALSGRFGRTASRFSRELLDKRWVHVVATDAHNTDSRPPKMKETYNQLINDYGREYADLLCIENPKAMFEDRQLPPQLEALELYDEEIPDQKGFFGRLFSR